MKGVKGHDRFVPPVMSAFRDAFQKRDATKSLDLRNPDGEAMMSGRRATPRNSVNESVLKQELAEDLSALLNTVNLAAAENLDGLDEVQSSILNYGIDDLTGMSADSNDVKGLGPRLKQILQHHEDRLVQGSVRLAAEAVTSESTARIAIHVNAEMYASPTDLPVEFIADFESYSGKVKIKQM